MAAETPFSHRTRARALASMAAEPVDLLVIGGGITGAGVARDAALRGFSVALVERTDFAAGTSSRSSKLIHGGVRYLSDLLRLFPNDLPRTLAAYNAGENAVFKYAGIPPYDETMTYVKRALTVYYGSPYGQATWFPATRGGKKLAGGFGSQLLEPAAVMPGMRYLGTH